MVELDVRSERVRADIAGSLVCQRAGISRSRLSDIERGYVEPRAGEVASIRRAIDELVAAKRQLAEIASKNGWPLAVLR